MKRILRLYSSKEVQLRIGSKLKMWAIQAGLVSSFMTHHSLLATDNSVFTTRRQAVIGAEEIKLESLVADEFQFFRDYPTNMLTSAQNIYSMILEAGTESVRTFRTTESVTKYNSLSTPTTENGGRMIVGQYEPLAELVKAIKSQASGNRSGSKVPLLRGTHGTGKSEFANVMANIMEYYSTNNPRYYYHELVWKLDHLKEIPLFAKYYTHRGESNLPSPLHASPLAILPKEYQKAVVEVASEYLSDKGFDFDVTPMLLDPLSDRIREEILTHYSTAVGDPQVNQHLAQIGYPLSDSETIRYFSPEEELSILSKFCFARRFIMEGKETMPIIDAQGDEPRYSELFTSTDPLISFLTGNPSNPLSKVYNGQILKGSRNLVFFDELFRNVEHFRNILLGILESRRIAYGSGPAVPFDAVVIAATNTSSIDKVSKDADSHAQLDRMITIPFEWPTEPNEVAKIMIYLSRSSNLKAIYLGDQDEENPSSFKGTLEDLFPAVDVQAMDSSQVFPSGKYKLFFGKSIYDPNTVHIMPHTLEFMAQFIAATRMITDIDQATKLGGAEQTIRSPIYCNPIDRLKFYTRVKTDPVEAAQIDLCRISKRLKEGSNGLPARSSGDWLTASIEEARKPENANTLTPTVARKVLLSFADDHRVARDFIEFQKWSLLMDQVIQGILIPQLESDFYLALNGGARAEQIYDEIMSEMLELGRDPEASEYISQNNVTTRIDKQRLKEISEIYKNKNGIELSFVHLANFHMRQIKARNNSHLQVTKIMKNQDLLGAISTYLANATEKQFSMNDALASVQQGGNSHQPGSLYTLNEKLPKLGYNDHGAKTLIEILKIYREQIKANNQKN